MIPVPVGEEVAPKLARLLYFVGAGFLCTAVINKWKDWERKSAIQKQQQFNGQTPESNSELVHKDVRLDTAGLVDLFLLHLLTIMSLMG